MDSRDSSSTSSSYFIFNEDEIKEKQISQVGVSACGATAALNVLVCFNIKVETEKAVNAVKTRLRKHVAPLPEYLKSRSKAGTSHRDIMNGIDDLTKGHVQGRFFAFYPKRDVDLHKWLLNWLKKGAVPIATLNPQKEQPPQGYRIADAWHHQIISGVSQKGVHLCNPIKIMSFDQIGKVLCSESILKIRLEDVLLRYEPGMDLSDIFDPRDKRWEAMNVIDQIIKLHEKTSKQMSIENGGESLLELFATEYVSIPAAYESGITLFMQKDSKHFEELVNCEDLPLVTCSPCL